MRGLLAAIALFPLAACGAPEDEPVSQMPISDATEIALDAAETFRVFERDGYRIVDIRAAVVNWGGGAVGQEEFQRLVLAPSSLEAPELTGDLSGATLIRTPVMRIASNYSYHEAITKALGINDRLVAVGGVKSYDDDIRDRVRRGEIAQVGYGWHSPPNLDALIAARPDVFLMTMGDLKNASAKKRIEALGIPVVPIFLENEPDYMGRVDYVRLIGMLTGQEDKAHSYVQTVQKNVAKIKAKAASQPTRTVLAAWYGSGDRWNPTVRNADAKLLRDANARNPFELPDDRQKDSFNQISTEELIARGTEADCWIMRDTHSIAFDDVNILRRFKAYREDCMFAADGKYKPDADTFDYYETAVIRPDLLLGDIARMLHPDLRDEPFLYIRPDRKLAR